MTTTSEVLAKGTHTGAKQKIISGEVNNLERFKIFFRENMVKLVGAAAQKASVLSFVLDGHDNEEVGKYLNKAGIAVRAGHHCAQPILRRFGYEGTVRPSLAFYNTPAEIELLAQTLHKLAAY
jgi:selenocysteine lyase/cysteine desulfurase